MKTEYRYYITLIVIEVIGVSGLLLLTPIFYVLNDSLKANNKQFYFDYKNGKYGFNTSSTRGADTFVPFSKTLTSGEALCQTLKTLYDSVGHSLSLDNISTGCVIFKNVDFSNVKTITFSAKASSGSGQPLGIVLFTDENYQTQGIPGGVSNTTSYVSSTLNLQSNNLKTKNVTLRFHNRGWFAITGYTTD